MKLHSHIARYIRRCGYAVALTLATGCIAHAEEPTIIEYLTDAVPQDLVNRAAQFNTNIDLSKPATPEGITVWNTQTVLDAVLNGNGAMRYWSPFFNYRRGSSNWDYGVFSYDVEGGHYIDAAANDKFTCVSYALRGDIQKALNSRVVSYIGATALRACKDHTLELQSDINGPWYDVPEGGVYTRDANRNLVKYTPRSNDTVYDEDGNITIFRETNSQVELLDSNGNALPVKTEAFRASCLGDGHSSTRAFILPVDEQVHIKNTTFTIDHSGFALLVGAFSQYGDVNENLIYVHDARNTDDIYGAIARHGTANKNTLILARVECVGHNINITQKEAGAYLDKYNNSGKVLAGLSSGAGGQYDANENLLFIYGSRVYQDVTSGSAAGNTHDNRLFINFSEISLGLMDVQSTYAGDSTYGTSQRNLAVVDDTFDALAAGAVEEDLSYYEQNGIKRTSAIPLVSVVHEDIVGGHTTIGNGEQAAYQNRVILKGITVTNNETGKEETTTVEGNVFGGVATNAGFTEPEEGEFLAGGANCNSVYVTGTNIKSIVSVPVLTYCNIPDNADLKDGSDGWSDMKLSVNVGSVTGGFVGMPGDEETLPTGWKPGNANENLVVLQDSYVENDVIGGYNKSWWSEEKLDEQNKPVTDAKGNPVRYGEASRNVVLLDGVTTPAHDDGSHDGHTHDSTVYGGWAHHGKTNDNHVYLTGTANRLNDTFLHGGWGNRAQTTSTGELIWKDDSLSVPNACYFDGTNFLAADKTTRVGKFVYGQLTTPGGSAHKYMESDQYWHTEITGFDGTYFYGYTGNQAAKISSTALAVRYNDSEWRDYLRYTNKVEGEFNGNQLVGCKFYVEGHDQPAATFDGETITMHSNTFGDGTNTLMSGIKKVEYTTAADGKTIVQAKFYSDEAGEKLVAQVGTFLTTRSYANLKGDATGGNVGISYTSVLANNKKPVELNLNGEYTWDPITGLTIKDVNNAVALHLTPNKIVLLDEQQNPTDEFSLVGSESHGADGTVLVQSGNVYDHLTKLDGYDEYDTYTRGNWLHVDGFQGKIRGFDHFEKLMFVVTEDTNRELPMLQITDEPGNSGMTYVNENGEQVPVTIKADISLIADELKPGDIIPLIGHEKNENNEFDGLADVPRDSVVDDESPYRRGVTRQVELETEFFEVNNHDDDLSNDAQQGFENVGVIKVVERKDAVTPEAKSLIEGRIATLTLNNMGGNLLAEQGIDSACRALEGGSPSDANTYIPVEQNGKGAVTYVPKDELSPGNRLFFAMNGAHNKVDSGSDVDVDGTNALVGVSRGFLEKRALTLGAFMETGWGKYHTHNNFGEGANVPYVRGTGETSYVGAGVLLRYRLSHLNKKLDGFSLDATLRAGRQETDYSTADLVDDYGSFASYEHESDYIAGHVGLNYTFTPSDKLSATLYARYLWTHISNDDADVCGESVTFEDMSSNRFRLGGRLAWQAAEKWTPYVGAAYEWECSGTARANTHGMGITAPSMRGGSVIGEIGTVWQPSLTRALWFEAALQGSVGKNENFGAKLGVSIGF